MKTLHIVVVPIVLSLSVVASAQTACPEGRSKLLIVGTYHMSNPGLDDVNTEADDVLSSRRQAEIEDVVERLAKFTPTKIAIEAPYGDPNTPSRYTRYLKGQYTLGRNEIDQIAFRLARHLNLTTVNPVDYPLSMNGFMPHEIEYPKPDPNAKAADSAPPKKQPLSDEEVLLRKSTVRDYLRHLNNAEAIRKSHAGYIDMLRPNDSAAIYSRSDLVVNWYKRNIRTFVNLNRFANPANDRVLLLIGSGHLAILQQLARESNYFCLVDADDYLK